MEVKKKNDSRVMHNDALQAFNEQMFKDVLTIENVVSKKRSVKAGEGKYYGYFLEKAGQTYFLEDFPENDKSVLDILPIKVKKRFETDYNKAVFYFIIEYVSVKIPTTKAMTFRELVNTLANFEHTNPTHFLLYKILVIAGYTDRVNYRVIGERGFGKDCAINNVRDMVGSLANIYGATFAKLEYSLKHKFLIFNEMGNLKSDDKHNMQQFLLAIGAFFNKYIKRSRACYTEDTRILTKEGFKYHNEIKPTEEIMTINPKTRELIWDKPLKLYEYNVKDEKIISFYNKTGTNMKVTPEHKIWYSSSYDKKYYKEGKAKDILKYKTRVYFDNSTKWNIEPHKNITIPKVKKITHKYQGTNDIIYDMDTFLKFIGWIISEGHIHKDGCHLELGQVDINNVKEFEETLKKMDIKYSKYLYKEKRKNCQNIWKFRIANKQLNQWCKNNIGTCSKDKIIPVEFRNLSTPLLRILFDTLIKGDGTIEKRGNSSLISYSTTSKILAENMQELGMKLGYNTVIMSNLPKNRTNMQYRINFTDKTNKNIDCKNINIKKYTGKVYCFKTNTGYYVTEREGKLNFQGNTEDTQEEYDISKMSLSILYNPPIYYIEKGQEFFDTIFTKAVLNRFIPFYFEGMLNEKFDAEFDVEGVVKSNMDTYKKIISTIRYYRGTVVMNKYLIPDDIVFDETTRRYERSFLKIADYISEYAEDEKEYYELLYELYSCYKKYDDVLAEALTGQ